MFKYLHSYLPEIWDAQVKHGFIDQYAGVRFCQSRTIDPAPNITLQFSTTAVSHHHSRW